MHSRSWEAMLDYRRRDTWKDFRVSTLDVSVYLKKDQAATSKVVFHTKIEIAVEMIRARASMLKLRGAIFDCWYLCEKIMKLCETLGLHWYSDLRTNRIVYLPEGKLRD